MTKRHQHNNEIPEYQLAKNNCNVIECSVNKLVDATARVQREPPAIVEEVFETTCLEFNPAAQFQIRGARIKRY
ncbi:hypothetical protein DQQ10_27650 [Pseudochryseolinea flava]|uniref:Uncharacterized protein n=1 Tax=Pseudochryseolinea flava TaxID=2059302 RepID=A0A364XV63_9BACT|nr:hypothetical protein DQQ10_27650 [Pseudochryseolinea flava]